MNYLPDCLRRGWCMISTRIAQWAGRKPESKTNLKRYFFGNLWFFCGSLSWFKGARGSWCHMQKVQLFSVSRIWKRTFSTFLLAWTEKCGDFFPLLFPSSSHNPQFPIRSFCRSLSKVQEEKSGNGMGQKRRGKRGLLLFCLPQEKVKRTVKRVWTNLFGEKCLLISPPFYFVRA